MAAYIPLFFTHDVIFTSLLFMDVYCLHHYRYDYFSVMFTIPGLKHVCTFFFLSITKLLPTIAV